MNAVRISICLAVLITGMMGKLASAQDQAPNSAPGRASVQNYNYDLPERDPWDPRFRMRTDIGDGVGYARGYQTFSGFLPFWTNENQSLFFVDPRIIVPYDGDFAANVGLGMRYFNEDINRVFGASFWYDHDNTYTKNYHQYGVSLESLGKYVDYRFNAYLPNNNGTYIAAQTRGLGFVGNSVSIVHNSLLETALRGGDFEVGGALPVLGDFGVRTYIGAYMMEAPEVGNTVGMRFRADAMVTQDAALQVGVTDDELFGTRVTGAVTLSFPFTRPTQWLRRPQVQSRLYAQTERNYRMQVYRRVETQLQALVNPADGQPFRVAHVRNSAATGGTGNAESPFNTLPTSVASDVDIIFVQRGDGTVTGMTGGITLANNQRLLGDGIAHTLTAVEGVFTLPGSTNGLLPTITNTNVLIPGQVVNQNAVTLANNNEVSGFNIVGATGNGIRGSAMSDFNINRLTVASSQQAAINLENAIGTGRVTNVTLSANTTGGLVLRNTTAGALDLQVTGSTISGSFARGVDLTLGGTTTGTINVSNNALSFNDLGSIFVDRRDTANFTTTINQNTITGSVVGLDGIGYRATGSAGASPLSLAITNNTITKGHVTIDTLADARVVANVTGNTISGAGDSGIRITSINSSAVGVGDPLNPALGAVTPTVLDGNVISTSGTVDPDAGIRIVAQDNALQNIQVTGTSRRTVLTNNRNGISIDNTRTSTVGTQAPGTYLIQGTDIVNTTTDGINLALTRPTNFLIGTPPGGPTNVTIGGPAAGQNVTITRSTTATGGDDGIDATLVGNSHLLTIQNTTIDRTGGDGIAVNMTNATGTTVNVANSNITRSVGDGINFVQLAGQVAVNVTGTSSTFNTGRGLDIFVTNSNTARLLAGSAEYNIGTVGNGNILSNNGGEGLFFSTVATLFPDPAIPLIVPALPANSISSLAAVGAVGNIYSEYDNYAAVNRTDGNPNNDTIAGIIGFDPILSTARMVAIDNTIQNNGADGLVLAVGTNTHQNVNLSGNTFGGNTLADVHIYPVNSGIALPVSGNAATVVVDPVASLHLVFGAIDAVAPFDTVPDTARPNTGDQINVTTAGDAVGTLTLPIAITQSSGAVLPAGTILNGLFVAANAPKPANRSARGFFVVQNSPPTFFLNQNTFTQFLLPQDVLGEFTATKVALPAGTPAFTGFNLITPAAAFPPTLFP